jgi:hypothetical protein
LRIWHFDGVGAEKVDDGERTVGDEDKLFVLLQEFSRFRYDILFAILKITLADASRQTQVFCVVHAVCLNAWELTSINTQTSAVTKEEGKSADVLQKLDLTCLGVHLEHKVGSIWFHEKHYI